MQLRPFLIRTVLSFHLLPSLASALPTAQLNNLNSSKRNFQVMIDPGHGGTDSGATHGEAKESDVVLKVGLILKSLIDQNPRFSSFLTRQSDRFLSLEERVKIAEQKKADLFISIHANASVDQRARGVEVYFQNHLPADEDSLYLAAIENKQSPNEKSNLNNTVGDEEDPTKKNDIHAIIEDLKRQDRMLNSYQFSKKLTQEFNQRTSDSTSQQKNDSHAIRQAPFYVVSQTSMPSILIELGFLTNPKEVAQLKNPTYQKEIAQKIYKGLLSYMEVKENRLHLGLFPKNQ